MLFIILVVLKIFFLREILIDCLNPHHLYFISVINFTSGLIYFLSTVPYQVTIKIPEKAY